MDAKYKLFNDRPFAWLGGYPLSIFTGQTRVTVSGFSEPPEDKISFMIETIKRERCSSVFALPPLMHELIKRQNELPMDWPVVIIMSGGQPMTKKIASCIGKSCKFLLCIYGCTEFIAMAKTMVCDPEDFTEYSCGKPMQYQRLEIRIVDEDGKTVPVNTRGEIYCRSPAMFKEYFNDPVKTRAAKTDDGWFKTDDVGRMTESGELFVEGRKSNMIISGGFNVAPEILEQVMKNFTGVESIAIVPVPDDIYYQVLCACVVKKSDSDVTEEKLQTFCANFHADKPGLFTVLPKFYLFLERFPETSTGKLDRRELEKIATQRFKHIS
ncbi:medium-chain acyl-CoA ligase ACSF2, mitochondrial-like [Mercenaria mercenaria]|uniref:medium-chain acyl-CoA ligase ACSF2, mitochondrial-like n=1 Tax=Mercenaria mercenaria TaxID=6596 RepID=UPI00234F9503|nr:medium-chain acyl-CoA ligase ACSF2, mitochondrial-like [Mercenaria mercenaria]